MFSRLTKPDAEQSKTKQGYFQLYALLKPYFWRCPESKALLLLYLVFQSVTLISFTFEDGLTHLWKKDQKMAAGIATAFEYFNFQRRIMQTGETAFAVWFYLSLFLGFVLNLFLPLGYFCSTSRLLQTVNNKVVGRVYCWVSVFGFFFFADVYLMPFRPDVIKDCGPACLQLYGLDAMKACGTFMLLWWMVQIIAIFSLSEHSRIAQGRYFIRQDYYIEILILCFITINRVCTNLFTNQFLELRCFLNFLLWMLLMSEIKFGFGIVHPLTRKYFVLFCILPLWINLAQIVSIMTGSLIGNMLRISLISAILFVPVYIFKTDDINVTLLADIQTDAVVSSQQLLNKLNQLLVLVREESLSPDYSVLLEGVVREFQEYISGDETELLNNFRPDDLLDKEAYFKKRRTAILRLITLYFMKGISRHSEYPRLRFGFVLFMFDFLQLRSQAMQFLLEVQGLEMSPRNFFRWVSLKSDLESELIRIDQEESQDKSKLNLANQKLKYDKLVLEVERTVIKQMEFWKLVNEENTKVRAIYESLYTATLYIENLDSFWKRECQYLDSIPKCQIAYGSYLKKCINQEKEGDELLQKAYLALEKAKRSTLGLVQLTSSSTLEHLDKPVALVRLTPRLAKSYISSCSVQFARLLNSQKTQVAGALLSDYMPRELVPDFLRAFVYRYEQSVKDDDSKSPGAKQQKNDPTFVDQSLELFPFLTANGKLLKEFYVNQRIILDHNGEKTLVLELRPEGVLYVEKILFNFVNFDIKYASAGYICRFLLEKPKTQSVNTQNESKIANLELPEMVLKKIQELVKEQFMVKSQVDGQFEDEVHGKQAEEVFTLKKSESKLKEPRLHEDILKSYNNARNSKRLQLDIGGMNMQGRLSFFPNELGVLSLSRDMNAESQLTNRDIPDDATHMTVGTRMSKLPISRGGPEIAKFCFCFDPTTLSCVGEFLNQNELAYRLKQHNYALEIQKSSTNQQSKTQGQGTDAVSLQNLSDDKYGEGVVTMRLNLEGKIHEIIPENEAEQQGLGPPADGKSVLTWSIASLLPADQKALDPSKLLELRDHTAMEALVNNLGKSQHFGVKIFAIAVKLMINVSAGILFYLLNVGLFDALADKMKLYGGTTSAATALMQTANLNAEKILWAQDKLKVTSFEQFSGSDLLPKFEYNDLLMSQLLPQIQASIAESTSTLERLGLSRPKALWASEAWVELPRPRSDTKLMTFKDTISTILSDALAHFNKSREYYDASNVDLMNYLSNSRNPLRKATEDFLLQTHEEHSGFSSSRRALLWILLLVKICLGIIFVTIALYLYRKEMAMKEEVICLFYGFLQSDVRKMLAKLEGCVSALNSRGFFDSDIGLEHDKEELQAADGADEFEDETSLQILMVKRAKTRGTLANKVDLNKSFTVFFALINTLYFVFIYFWNLSNYMQFWSLARLSRGMADLSLGLHAAEGLLSAQILAGYGDQSSGYLQQISTRLQEHRSHRLQSLSELIGNKFSAFSDFDQLLNPFFQDNCGLFSDTELANKCTTVLDGSIQKGYYAFLGSLESQFDIMTSYLGYLQDKSVTTPAWIYSSNDSCLQTLPQPYNSAGLWSCFSRSDQFNTLRAVKKLYMPPLVLKLTSQVVAFVQEEISVTKTFNLQFLVIVLVLITILLGVSWMAILLRDNRDVGSGSSSFRE